MSELKLCRRALLQDISAAKTQENERILTPQTPFGMTE
jgi:hypothetical protein